jgi:cardiolipin synthase
MATPVLTVANQLTLLRMALVPLLVVLVLWREFPWALVVFVVAGATDVLDGLIARLGHQRTTLGAMMDPVADKLLLMSSFVVLTWGEALYARIPTWLTVTTLSRDAIIVITVVMINLTLGRRIFYPSVLGKVSTTVQTLTVGVVLLMNALGTDFAEALYLYRLTFVFTVASALHYVYMASAGKQGADTP